MATAEQLRQGVGNPSAAGVGICTDGRFRDRDGAGTVLAEAVAGLGLTAPLVVALPRGGVPVAAKVAARLAAPLEVLVVRKVGVPWSPEVGLGALAEDGTLYIDRGFAASIGLGEGDVQRVVEREAAEVRRRVDRYRGARGFPDVRGRAVVLVDDGLATGGTARTAARAMRRAGAARVVLAVPVAAPESVRRLQGEVDAVVALLVPPDFRAVGEHYERFEQVEDAEVLRILAAAERPIGLLRRDGHFVVDANGVELPAELVVPEGARGLVVQVHPDAGRDAPDSERLHAERLATLDVCLLTPDEQRVGMATGALGLDVPLVSARLGDTLAAVASHPPIAGLPVGLQGLGAGAPAVLVTAAREPRVRAVVCRGGPVGLAQAVLPRVTAPVLLLADPAELAAGERVVARLPRARLERSGPDDDVRAAGWFARWLDPGRR